MSNTALEIKVGSPATIPDKVTTDSVLIDICKGYILFSVHLSGLTQGEIDCFIRNEIKVGFCNPFSFLMGILEIEGLGTFDCSYFYKYMTLCHSELNINWLDYEGKSFEDLTSLPIKLRLIDSESKTIVGIRSGELPKEVGCYISETVNNQIEISNALIGKIEDEEIVFEMYNLFMGWLNDIPLRKIKSHVEKFYTI